MPRMHRNRVSGMKNAKKISPEKRHERFRVLIQALSFAFHNGYIMGWIKGTPYSGINKSFCVPGLNCYSCPGAIGACPIGSLQAVLDSGTMKFSLYVLGFIGAVGMLFGRLVCGWLCPFGAVQDLLYRIPLFKKVKNLPGHKYLRWLKYAVLLLFVIVLPMAVTGPSGTGQPWFCEWICPSGTLLGGIPLVIANQSLRAAAGWRFAWKLTVLLLILLGSVKFYRPFCKYLCPLGAIYGGCNKLSLYRLKVDDEKCVTCGACQRACGMDIPVWKNPNSAECIRCGKCMAACPTGAISSTWRDLVNGKKGSAPGTATATVADAAGKTETLSAENPQVSTAARPRHIAWRVALSVLILFACVVGLVFGGIQVFAQTCGGAGSDFISFFVYLGGGFGVLCADVSCIVFAVKLIGSINKPASDTDVRQLAFLLPALIAGLNLVLIPLCLLLGLILLSGAEPAVFGSVAKLSGLYLPFWFAPAIPVLLSACLFKNTGKRA